MKGSVEWWQYLMGATYKFEIWTDHRNLQYFRKPQDLNRHHAQWIIDLADYDFELIHKPGKTHLKPDILSRPPDPKKGEDDNNNTILLKPWHFQQQEFIFESLDDNFIKWIKALKKARDQVVERTLAKKEKDWNEDKEGIVTWKQQIYVPWN